MKKNKILIPLVILMLLVYILINKKSNKLKIGDIVIYNPPISSYKYNEKYINNNNNVITLSNNDKKLKITKWKVLNINKNKIELVPYKIPSYELYIYGPQGYNNGVYILNEICSKLYSDKNITARSINVEDIEKIIDKKALDNIKSKTDYFKIQPSKTGYIKNSWYPTIYEFEKDSVIDDEKKDDGLKLSDSYELIDNNLKKANNIRPYKTYYSTIDYNTTKKLLGDKYAKILIPNKESTNYWVATRSIGNGVDSAHFDLRRINEGYLRGARVFDSNNKSDGFKANIFPVITVDKKQIKKTDYYYVY